MKADLYLCRSETLVSANWADSQGAQRARTQRQVLEGDGGRSEEQRSEEDRDGEQWDHGSCAQRSRRCAKSTLSRGGRWCESSATEVGRTEFLTRSGDQRARRWAQSGCKVSSKLPEDRAGPPRCQGGLMRARRNSAPVQPEPRHSGGSSTRSLSLPRSRTTAGALADRRCAIPQ